jgi:hypothetical protein
MKQQARLFSRGPAEHDDAGDAIAAPPRAAPLSGVRVRRQIEMFPPEPKTPAELLAERVAAATAERFARDATKPTREVMRSRRKRDVRARTISVKRMTKRELELGRLLYPELEDDEALGRPKTRAACADVPRPCPFVGCKQNLYLDVSARTGAIKLNFPDLDPDEVPASSSCALDVADRGGATLEDVGAIMNLTRERIRQVEVKGLARLQASGMLETLREFHGDGGVVGKRRLPVLPPRDEESEDQDEADRDQDAELELEPDRLESITPDAE